MSCPTESESVCAWEIGSFSKATVAKTIPNPIINANFQFIFINFNFRLIFLSSSHEPTCRAVEKTTFVAARTSQRGGKCFAFTIGVVLPDSARLAPTQSQLCVYLSFASVSDTKAVYLEVKLRKLKLDVCQLRKSTKRRPTNKRRAEVVHKWATLKFGGYRHFSFRHS